LADVGADVGADVAVGDRGSDVTVGDDDDAVVVAPEGDAAAATAASGPGEGWGEASGEAAAAGEAAVGEDPASATEKRCAGAPSPDVSASCLDVMSSARSSSSFTCSIRAGNTSSPRSFWSQKVLTTSMGSSSCKGGSGDVIRVGGSQQAVAVTCTERYVRRLSNR